MIRKLFLYASVLAMLTLTSILFINRSWAAELLFNDRTVNEVLDFKGQPLNNSNSPLSEIFGGSSEINKTNIFEELSENRPDVLWMRGGHASVIGEPVYFPDGTHFVTASSDNTVKIWRASDNMIIRTIYAFNVNTMNPKLSLDGNTLAVSGFDRDPQNPTGAVIGSIKIYNTTDLSLRHTIPVNIGSYSDGWNLMEFSPTDSSLMAAATGNNRIVQLWNVTTGALVKSFDGNSASDYPGISKPFAFHPNGEWIAGLEQSYGLAVVKISDGAVVRRWANTPVGPTFINTGIPNGGAYEFSPDGRYVLSGRWGGDGNHPPAALTAWDMNSAVCSRNPFNNVWGCTGPGTDLLPYFNNNVHAENYTFSPDGSKLVLGGYTSNPKTAVNYIWNTSDWSLIRSYTSNPKLSTDGQSSRVAFTPDGNGLLSVSEDMRLYNAANGDLQKVVNAQFGFVKSVAYSPDNQLAASVTHLQKYAALHLFDAADGNPLRSIDLSETSGSNPVPRIIFTPDSQNAVVIMSNTAGAEIRVFDAATGAVVRTIDDNAVNSGGAAFVSDSTSPNEKLLAVTGGSGIRFYRLSDGALVRSLDVNLDSSEFAFSPDGATLLFISGGRPRLVNSSNGNLIRDFDGMNNSQTGVTRSLAFSQDGQYFITGTDATSSNAIRVYNVSQSAPSYTIPVDGKVTELAFAPDSASFTAFTADGKAGIYQTNDAAVLRQYDQEVGIFHPSSGVTTQIFSAAYSNDGKNIFWGRQDATVVMARNPFYVPSTYAIGGQVKENGVGLSGVRINLAGSSSAAVLTDSAGNFSFPNLAPGGNYIITPAFTNYTITPANISVNNLSANQTLNFNAAQNCSYSIPPGASVSPSSGSYSVAVTAASGCSWTTSSNASWLTVTSGANGSGNGTVSYTAAANTGTIRTGTLTIAGKTFTVTQGTTYNVADRDVPGLIAAINSANSSPGTDIINLASGGVYTLTGVYSGGQWEGPTGLPLITSEIILNGNGATIQRSRAAGTPAFRIIYNAGDLTLNDVVIKGGKSAQGYPGYIGGGGGIRNELNSKLRIVNCTITENGSTEGEGTTNPGGGILNYGGTLTVINSTISHNTGWGGYGGGGILNFSRNVGAATTTISNSTIYENQAKSLPGGQGRGDAVADAFSPAGSITVKNSIVASPNLGIGNDCYSVAQNSLGNNIYSDASCSANTNLGDRVISTLQLGTLAYNGGLTPTHALLTGSPAINAVPIANCTIANGGAVSTDQRGVPRPQNGNCDVGAFEYKNPFVISNGDVGGLIAAINAANTSPGPDIINLAQGGTYTLTSVNSGGQWEGPTGLPLVASQIIVNGNGATIQRSAAEGTPAFRIFYNYGDLTLNNIVIKGGKSAQGYSGYIGGGGGIRNEAGAKLRLVSSTITQNSGSEGGSNEGGGILNYGGRLTVENSTISHNTGWGGAGGGGILNFSRNVGIATTTISNSTIYENRADASLGFQGRGDAIADGFSPAGSIALKNTILASPSTGYGDDCYSFIPRSLGHNIYSDNTCGANALLSDLVSANLQLTPLTNNGGLTPTHALLYGNPGIDSVPLADCLTAEGNTLTTDQRGIARPQSALCDVGAYEANAPVNVANGDVSGLIAAINAANANPGPDTINLSQGGIYTLTTVNSGGAWEGPSGLPIVTGNSRIVINGNGATIQRSSSEETPAFRIFFNYGDLTLNDVVIKGGKSAQGYSGYVGGGGGIRNNGGGNNIGQLTIVNSTITANSGSEGGSNEGGGILNYAGRLTIENSTISHNTGWGGAGGGGILNYSHGANATTTVSNSTIYENKSMPSGRGDAIADAFSAAASITIKNSIVASPTFGLGSDCYSPSSATMANISKSLGRNITSDNTCGFSANGDLIASNLQLGALADNGGLTPTHALLPGNPAVDAIPTAECKTSFGASMSRDQRGVSRPIGAACDIGSYERNDFNAPVITVPENVTVEATGAGGATVSYQVSANDDFDGDVQVSCTPASGGTFAVGTTEVVCAASDRAGNSATARFFVTVEPLTYSISGSVAVGNVSLTLRDTANDQIVATTISSPNGAYEFTRVKAGLSYTISPILNGHYFSPGLQTVANLNFNQTGINFAVTDSADCQQQSCLVVNSTADAVDADINDNFCDINLNTPGEQCTLRAAVQIANARPANDAIVFDLHLIGAKITLSMANQIQINNNGTLAIRGLGANRLTIDGGAGTNRIFYAENTTTTLSDLTLTGGNGVGSNINNYVTGGGAILVIGGSLTIDGVNITQNITTGSGSGIYYKSGTHYIRNSTLSANSTSNSCAGFGNDSALVFVLNSTISNNTSSRYGGGLCTLLSGNTNLRNVTITKNTASWGGGIYTSSQSILSFGNSIVAGNTITGNVTSPYAEILFGNSDMVISDGNNFIGDSLGDSTKTGGLITYQSTDVRDQNPLLGPLSDNGGAVPTHALLEGSPAANAGSNALAVEPTNNQPLVTDQRGVGFNRVKHSTVDIGAFESDIAVQVPAISWNPQANITYGTPLGASHLNASASYNGTQVAGTFSYNPPAGTVLNTGTNQTLSVVFNPVDTSSFSQVTRSVNINVNRASTQTTVGSASVASASSVPLTAVVRNSDTGTPFCEASNSLNFRVYKASTQVTSMSVGCNASTNMSSLNVDLSAFGEGTYTVYAFYNGSSNYNPSSGVGYIAVGSNTVLTPSLGSLSPVSAADNATAPLTLTILGSGFNENSAVLWRDPVTQTKTSLTVTSRTSTQLQATIPTSLLARADAYQITIDNTPANATDGESSPQTFFVTSEPVAVTGVTSAVANPTTNTATTTVSGSSGTVVAYASTTSGTTATGTLTLAEYQGDPVGTTTTGSSSTTTFTSTGGYFDVHVSSGSTYTTLNLSFCNTGGSTLYWFDGSSWKLVSPQTYYAAGRCITVNLNNSPTNPSSPTISQLTGTVIAAAGGPEIKTISVTPAIPQPSGSQVNLNASFIDPDGLEGTAYQAEINWGDGTTTPATAGAEPLEVSDPNTPFTASHTYASPGVYTVSVKVRRMADGAYGSAAYEQYVVIYDPAGGFVTGGGWINSPVGAYSFNPDLVGRATFGFSSKYQPGANVPTGQTQFNFHASGMDFRSQSYEWLVISGARSQFKGKGKINGTGNYGFILTAVDGQINGGGGADKFRIKIWDIATGNVVYDNQSGNDDSATPTTTLGGGSIVIHKQ